MSRSGYVEYDDYDTESTLAQGRWRAQVMSSIRGKRGQKFLRELAAAMDAMPEKELFTGALVTPEGDCCTMGVLCKARGLDVSKVDDQDPEEVGQLLGITHQLAAEVAFLNDEMYNYQTPKERWISMRGWVEKRIDKEYN